MSRRDKNGGRAQSAPPFDRMVHGPQPRTTLADGWSCKDCPATFSTLYLAAVHESGYRHRVERNRTTIPGSR